MLERLRPRPVPEKHLPYFKFVKAAAAPGCPVCAQVGLAMDEWFENLLYESANDRPLRRRLDAESGLCPRHLRRLCAGKEGDGLGAAVIYREILGRAVERLGSSMPPEPNRGKCAACDQEADAESRYLGTVADFLDEAEMRAAIEASGGLCLRHAAAVMVRRRGAGSGGWFARLHRDRAAALLGTLDRYIASFELSTEERRALMSREEELAWKGLAELLDGDAAQ